MSSGTHVATTCSQLLSFLGVFTHDPDFQAVSLVLSLQVWVPCLQPQAVGFLPSGPLSLEKSTRRLINAQISNDVGEFVE